MFNLKNKNTIEDSNEVMKHVNKKTSIPSIINPELTIKGDLSSENVIEVFGAIDGNINCVVLSMREGSKVKGKVIAKYVKIAGQFEGEIQASIIHVTSTGSFNGKAVYGIISIEEKGKFEGSMVQKVELLQIKEVAAEASGDVIEMKKKKSENE